MMSLMEGAKLMEQSRITKLIETRIEEHQTEITGCEKEIEKLQVELKGTRRDIVAAGKIMVLKDKAMFHKGATMVLADLKKDIENANP